MLISFNILLCCYSNIFFIHVISYASFYIRLIEKTANFDIQRFKYTETKVATCLVKTSAQKQNSSGESDAAEFKEEQLSQVSLDIESHRQEISVSLSHMWVSADQANKTFRPVIHHEWLNLA